MPAFEVHEQAMIYRAIPFGHAVKLSSFFAARIIYMINGQRITVSAVLQEMF